VIQRGTGQSIKVLNRPLAGKTGTSSDFRDAWFIGFSPDLALGVFIGKDNFQSLGNGEQGALAAAPIFRDFMKEALADVPATPFRIPQGIVLVPTSPFTGAVMQQGAPGSILEAFKPGTEPGMNYAVSDIDDPGVDLPAISAAADEPGQGTAQPAAASGGPPPPPTSIGTGTGGLY
jgi:penicillin-binding protein 1A